MSSGHVVFLDQERVKTAILMYLKEVHGISMGSVRVVQVDKARVEFADGVPVPCDFDKVPAGQMLGAGI